MRGAILPHVCYNRAFVDPRDYLERIRADRPRGATEASLAVLHEQHLSSVPFENLDIHYGIPIRLDLPAILDKIVRRRRGGFCYELNGAFSWLLGELGFRVTLLSAEVCRPDGGFGIPFDHMTLRVDLDQGVFLADVGFGDSFLRPLPLEPGGGSGYHLTREGEFWFLRHGDETKYRFTLEPRRLDEFRPGCLYHQSSPESTFTNRVVTTRATPSGRVTLTRERRILRDRRGATETPIESEEAWLRALADDFDIVLDRSCQKS